ncbi:hypothetical protein POTOM_035105 [Populus tomentosa]|uniref:Uncharacterized protein n=1 Tax=Populus tomentosa TaxID=118781 RepID=A0A8X7Z3T2_POPTO|nr:hypothetical protein POTOM_035105 [Populus tomentosa]
MIARCDHEQMKSAEGCIAEIIGEYNPEHFLGTQDTDMRKKFQEVPGVPLIFGLRNALFLEPPSAFQQQLGKNSEEQSHMSEFEAMFLKKRTKNLLEIQETGGTSDEKRSKNENLEIGPKRYTARKGMNVKDRPQIKRKKAKVCCPLQACLLSTSLIHKKNCLKGSIGSKSTFSPEEKELLKLEFHFREELDSVLFNMDDTYYCLFCLSLLIEAMNSAAGYCGFLLCKRMSEEHEDQEQVLFLEEGKKKKLKKEAKKARKRGVRYTSRVPPDSSSIDQVNDNNKSRKGGDGAKAKRWVEFASKSNAKRVANLLNGGKKRSQFYYDHWNIKYLSKFKWDNLTDKIAYKKGIREQKIALEISAAKRERDFYLKKVDQSCALSSIEERMKKDYNTQVPYRPVSMFGTIVGQYLVVHSDGLRACHSMFKTRSLCDNIYCFALPYACDAF